LNDFKLNKLYFTLCLWVYDVWI